MTTATNDGSTELQDEVLDVFADDAMEVITAEPNEIVEPDLDVITEDDDDDEQIPEKFKGKSIAEVIGSYTALESEFGRRNNEVGDMRKTLDSILKQQLDGNADETEDDEDAASVEKALANSPTLKAVTDGLTEQHRLVARSEFDKVHPEAEKLIASKAFVKWVTDSPVRTNQFRTANTGYDYDTVSEMLGTYTELTTARKEKTAVKREGTMKALETPNANGGGDTSASKRKVFKLSDLMKLRDTDPARYEKLGPVINKAYADGRVLRDK
jgi:hypothetical protein